MLCAALGTAHSEEILIPGPNALTLNGNLEVADGGALADGVLLITHGTLAHNGMEIIATLQELMAEREVNSLAINLSLGIDNRHGMYDCPQPHTHRHEDALDEIDLWLAWLAEQGAERVVLAGHSRGGNQTAMWGALNRAESAESTDLVVEGLVLIAPMTWEASKAAKSYAARYGSELAPLLAEAEARVAAGRADELFENIGFVYCPGTSATAAAVRSYYRDDARRDTPQLLEQLDRPTLLIAGGEDSAVPDLAERVEAIDLAPLQVEVLDGAGHFFRDLYAEDMADLISDFLIDTLDW